jgi:hypothetical protein
MIGSISSGLLDNAAEIALARALSLTPFVGFIGKTVFMTSQFFVRTFENKTHKTETRQEGEKIGFFLTRIEIDRKSFYIAL